MAMATLTVQNSTPALDRILDQIIQYLESLRDDGINEIEMPVSKPDLSKATPSRTTSVVASTPGETRASPPNDSSVEKEMAHIASQISACTQCELHAARTKTVPGQGHFRPDILFVGEGPGADEDLKGVAFIGRAGQLLTRLILRMGYQREDVFIANVVKCRPPNNRKPLPDEMKACLPYLQAQIAVLKPKVIVTLGATALEGLIHAQSKIAITRMRGQWLSYENIPLMPTFHPSYLLRNQSAMWDVWTDMQEVLKHLGRTPPPRKS